MKFCSWPFEYLYLDNFDGLVWLCPWMKRDYAVIGNLFESDIHDIWKSEQAIETRSEILKGNFDICRLDACPFLQNNSLPEISYSEIENFSLIPEFAKTINLAHDFICNQYCETCRSEKFKPKHLVYKNKMSIINDKILPFIQKCNKISLSGHGDPFASPYMMKLMSQIRPENKNFNMLLESNGVFFDEIHWNKIRHLSCFDIDVVITVNSYNKFNYEHISRGGNYNKLIENLDFVSSLRKNKKLKSFAIALVIQDRNFREIPDFIEHTFKKYECDQILLRPVYQWGTMPEDVFWFKDVLNPMHPYHKEYLEILDHPALTDKRVFHFGGRTLHPARPYPATKTREGLFAD